MKIVIDIGEDVYKRSLVYKDEQLTGNSANDLAELTIAVANGTPLPKGHGVLKDVTNLMRGLYTDMQTIEETFMSSDVYKMIDKECPTIIDADTESEDKA